MRVAGCADLEKFPFLPTSPRIFDTQAVIDVLYVVFHWESEVAFPVECTSDEGNRAARHKLADENYAASPGVGRFFPHVEAQVHFFEIAMQRDRKTEKTSIEKQKSDNADERLAVFIIDLGPHRNKPFNQSRINDVIQHRQITPVGGKKWFHGGSAVTLRLTESIVDGADTIAEGHSLRLGHRTEIGTLRGENPVRPNFVVLPWLGWKS